MTLHARRACRPEAFETRYRLHPDPWGFESSPYERQRYDVTLASLRQSRYRRAFEPGCSIGSLTALLAPRCDDLLATDVSETALARARERCAGYTNVRFERRGLEEGLAGRFDLIVLSEIGYYFERDALASIVQRLAAQLDTRGELIAVHWLGSSPDHLLHGDEVHATLGVHLRLVPAHSERHEGFRLDSWVRT